jgi:hypothetical protein
MLSPQPLKLLQISSRAAARLITERVAPHCVAATNVRSRQAVCFIMSYRWRAVFLVGVCAFLLAQRATAATITVNAPDIYGRTFIDVLGQLGPDDDKTIMSKVGTPAEAEKVIVTLMSNGGSPAAIGIGDFIRLTGMTTYVPAGQTCASTCAFVWLAGAPC